MKKMSVRHRWAKQNNITKAAERDKIKRKKVKVRIFLITILKYLLHA